MVSESLYISPLLLDTICYQVFLGVIKYISNFSNERIATVWEVVYFFPAKYKMSICNRHFCTYSTTKVKTVSAAKP